MEQAAVEAAPRRDVQIEIVGTSSEKKDDMSKAPVAEEISLF